MHFFDVLARFGHEQVSRSSDPLAFVPSLILHKPAGTARQWLQGVRVPERPKTIHYN